jgi:hypothetical protein
LQAVASHYIPKLDCSVKTTAGESRSIRAEAERPNFICMFFKDMNATTINKTPDFDGCILTTTGKNFAIGMESDGW